MKSILFTHFRDKLLSDEKTQTTRAIMCPRYEENIEEVYIDFKHKNELRERLFIAKVLEIYPKRIRNYTLEEARADGFNSIKEYQKGIMEINNIKNMNFWTFIIPFERTSGNILKIVKDPNNILNQKLTIWI
ncbi:MAG: hypothetical protein ACFFDN_00560 [Candidatus Hodarchaeota archaeon]